MPPKPPHLQIAASKPRAIIKVVGRANFNLSVSFKKLLNRLIQEGYQEIYLQTDDCLLMDSTFIGVLAGFNRRLTEQPEANHHTKMTLWRPPERVQELLENLGILELFTIHSGDLEPPKAFDAVQTDASTDKQSVTKTSLEAHETLMALNQDNIERFEDVTHFLKRELEGSNPD